MAQAARAAGKGSITAPVVTIEAREELATYRENPQKAS